MKITRTWFSGLTVSAGMALLLASPALGSSGGEVEMVPFFSSNFLWAVINFSILAFVLYRFGKKPFKEGLEKRQAGIEQALRDAEEAKESAAKNLAEAEQRLREKETEVKAILDEARQIAVREKEKMVALGEDMSTQIVSHARENLDQEMSKARQALRAEAVVLAMELAESRIRAAVDPSGQERLVREAIEKMEAIN